jgi:stage III sporulation protein SpoIIIAA
MSPHALRTFEEVTTSHVPIPMHAASPHTQAAAAASSFHSSAGAPTSTIPASFSPSSAPFVTTHHITSMRQLPLLRSTLMEVPLSKGQPYRILYLHTREVHAQVHEQYQQQLGDVALAARAAGNEFRVFIFKRQFLSEMVQAGAAAVVGKGGNKNNNNNNDELRQLLLDPSILKVAYDLYGLAPFLRHVLGDVEAALLLEQKGETQMGEDARSFVSSSASSSVSSSALDPTLALIPSFRSTSISPSPMSLGQGTAGAATTTDIEERQRQWQRFLGRLSFLDMQLLLESGNERGGGEEERGGGEETKKVAFDAPISALLGAYAAARAWPQDLMRDLHTAFDHLRKKEEQVAVAAARTMGVAAQHHGDGNGNGNGLHTLTSTAAPSSFPPWSPILLDATKLRLQCLLSGDYHAKGGARPVHLTSNKYIIDDGNSSSKTKKKKGQNICSWELHRARVLHGKKGKHHDGGGGEEEEEEEEANTLHIFEDLEPLLQLIPPSLIGGDVAELKDGPLRHSLLEFCLDLGHRPRVKIRGERLPQFLHAHPSVVVQEGHLNSLMEQIGPKVGHDHRAGIDGTLHRISVIPDRARSQALGATLRVGRHVTGNVGFLYDLLEAEPHRMPSILVLGSPGTGKTTIIRELARLLSLELHLEVLIIDTSNEIAGDGYVTHPSVGLSRRMMVRTRDEQADVMVEGVQNHTPEVMVIDEIGRLKEVRAARTIKERGVALIGSAHGDFRALLRNPDLKGLLGGLTTVTLGDLAAKYDNKGEKLQRKREYAPVFDMVVELQRGKHHEWHVYRDVSKIVDAIYAGKPYSIERRVRDPDTGRLYMEPRVTRQEEDFME